MKQSYINNRLHLAVQMSIKAMFPEGSVFLEQRFKGHIADIYWPEKKIVFEVQCSPISYEAAKKRTEDLEKLGLTVIWILHQKTFNKKHLSPSELYFVKQRRSYYTNLSQAGEGWVFDQEEAISDFKRLAKSPPRELDLSELLHKRSTICFKNEVTSLGFLVRISIYPDIWKLKKKIFLRHIKREFAYYYTYFKWKISL